MADTPIPSQLAQSVARYVIVAFAALFSKDAADLFPGGLERAVEVGTPVVAVLGALLWSWVNKRTLLNTVPPDVKAVPADAPISTQARVYPPGTVLKALAVTLALLGGAGAAVTTGGCAQNRATDVDPLRQSVSLYTDMNASYVAALQVCEQAMLAGLLDVETQASFEDARRLLQGQLERWEVSLRAGVPYRPTDAFRAALDDVRRLAGSIEARTRS